MCGITGVYYSRTGRPAETDLVERMCLRIVHRGPDDQGTLLDGPVGLGMRRLSIIDLGGGHQPIFNEDGTVGVVFNGEIYNYQELRQELLERGHQLRTHSDTETLVHLYEDEGPAFVQRLNGMFAFALWDAKAKRLVLARDRIGKKPLYYAWTADGLVFGSEIKCLLESDAVRRDIDRQALYHYFCLGYIPHPLSVYQHVRQLPPAGRLIVEGDGFTVDRYWKLRSQVDRSLDRNEVRERLHALVDDAVRRRMISDVPLGAFLSGGLDSSIVVARMAQHSSRPVKTFHIDFGDPQYSELEYGRAVAQRFGTEHHELVVRPSALDVLDKIVEHHDEPFGDPSSVPTWYVSELTRQHVTVALAGDGGDESFGGYNRYLDALRRRPLPPWLRHGLGALGRTVHGVLPRNAPGRRYFRSIGMDGDEYFAVGSEEMEAREFLSPDFLRSLNGVSTYELLRPQIAAGDHSDRLAPLAYLDAQRYLPDDILVKVDRMSMAHSLEVRAPLLDYRVVELAATLPHDWKIAGGDTKVILKDAFRSELPPVVLEPRKRGFSMPLAKWLRGELRPALEEALSDISLAQSGLFNLAELRGLAQEHWSGARDRRGQLWRFLFFARWWHKHQGAPAKA